MNPVTFYLHTPVVTVAAFLLIIGSAPPAQAGRYAGRVSESTCEYTRQLQDPLTRKLFLEEMDRETAPKTGQQVANEDEQPVSFFNIPADTPEISTAKGIDRFSQRCLSCHDDLGASLGPISVRDDPMRGRRMMGAQETNHPIGMTYDRYAAFKRGFKKVSPFTTTMRFFDGKVGCLTCHNPTNPAKSHLVMSDRQSALCLTCHDK